MKKYLFGLALSLLVFPFAFAAPAAARDYYGAIAYSPRSAAYGVTYNISTRSNAERRAIRECASRTNARDCRVLIWFRNACGAVANSPDGAYGSGWADTRARAEAYAVSVCSRNGDGCRVLAWACTAR